MNQPDSVSPSPPQPKAIELRRDLNQLVLRWRDGTESRLAAWILRTDCRCAGCVDEVTGARILDPSTVPIDLCVTGAQLVGNYALRLVFSDGHDNGLFTWTHLWSLGNTPGPPTT